MSLGERCQFETQHGTICYIGAVPPTKGVWYGVEWDEPRGKHDGTHNGERYFTCAPFHGSFVRRNKIALGVSAGEGLERVYGQGGISQEESTLVLNKNTTHETLIQMVGFDKLSSKQKNFENLKDVALSNRLVARADDNSSFAESLVRCTSLSLTDNLISSLPEVFKIAGYVKNLRELDISGNVISDWNNDVGKDCFRNLQKLYLNRMKLTWDKVLVFTQLLTVLEEVHVCFNSISSLTYDESLNNLKTLNLEGNEITDWSQVLTLNKLDNLQFLILSQNKISRINFSDSNVGFTQLKSFSLNQNCISKWSDINEVNKLNTLREFRFKDNPLCTTMSTLDLRQELICRLPRVELLNGSNVDEKERHMAEIDFVKKYNSEYNVAVKMNKTEAFGAAHPTYAGLVKRHGLAQSEEKEKRLSENLLVLTLSAPDDPTKSTVTKKLPLNTTVRQLKAILQRSFKVQLPRQNLSYVDATGREIPLDDNMKQLNYFSVSSGDTILLRW